MDAKKLPKFRIWLHQYGAEMLEPTNPYEVIRFKCKHGTGIIYQGKKGLSVSAPFVTDAYECYQNGRSWDGKFDNGARNNTSQSKKNLISRDGHGCFYCGDQFSPDELTQEHLLCVVHQGPNRIENKVLACKPCNELAGNMILVEKIMLRDRMKDIT